MHDSGQEGAYQTLLIISFSFQTGVLRHDWNSKRHIQETALRIFLYFTKMRTEVNTDVKNTISPSSVLTVDHFNVGSINSRLIILVIMINGDVVEAVRTQNLQVKFFVIMFLSVCGNFTCTKKIQQNYFSVLLYCTSATPSNPHVILFIYYVRVAAIR